MSEYEASCSHFWKVESVDVNPGEPDSYAFCRKCGAERLFPKEPDHNFNRVGTKASAGGIAKAKAMINRVLSNLS